MRLTTVLLFLLTLIQAPAEERLLIVASTTQVADLARQVVGDRIEVRCVLAPGADPHTYIPTPRDAAMVARAALLLQNGLHLEGKNWMATLAADAGRPLATVSDGLLPIELGDGEDYPHDPHAWFDPRNAALYANNILRAVSAIDSANAGEYQARTALLLTQLRALDAWIREQVNRIPSERRILITSHDAFAYYARAYGFTAQAPVGWSTGAEMGAGMTPERRRQIIASIRETGVPAIFVETSVNPALIRDIAREAGVEVGDELYSDSMGPAGSAGETYIGMMRENTLRIVNALAPK